MESFMWLSLLALCGFSVALDHEGHGHAEQQTQSLPSSEQRVDLTVYYEALCGDSIKFFKEQLDPTYKKLGKYMNVKFVPYGKATQWYSNNSYQFECHHGVKECYGNIVQACAIEVYHDEKDLFNFLSCLMTTVNPKDVTNETYPVDKCGKDLEVSNLKRCIEGSEGLRRLSEMGNITSSLKPQLQSVPAVAVNKLYSYDEQKNALSNLKPLVCKRLEAVGTNPAECRDSSSVTVTSSILLVTITSIFLATIVS